MRKTSRAEEIAITSGVERYANPTAAQMAEIERYRRDPFAHLDDGHIYVYDLVSEEETLFKAWEHQREVVRAWVDMKFLERTGILRFRNVLEEKSRQMGITWILAYVCLWALAWHPVRGFMMHRREREVDDGGSGSTVDSFFGKIRFMAQHPEFPDYIRPPLEFAFKRITNLARSGTFLRGDSANPDPGRGGRYTFAILDEAARIPNDGAVHTSLTRACPQGRFYNSTPHGENNMYFHLIETRPKGYTFLRQHWSDNPVYARGLHVAGSQPEECELCANVQTGEAWIAQNPTTHRYPGKLTSPWYDQAVTELTDEQVAQELDIDYQGSLEARLWPEFSEEIHVAPRSFGFNALMNISFAIDYGATTSPTSVIFLQESPTEIRAFAEFEQNDLTPEQDSEGMKNALRIAGVPDKLLVKNMLKLMQGVGDPAGRATEKGIGRPLIAEYADLGWRIVSQPTRIDASIIAVKRLLMGKPKRLVISPTCPKFIRHLKNNRWPTDRNGQVKPGATAPLNDEHNHMCSAFRYYVAFNHPPPSSEVVYRHVWEQLSPGMSGKLDESLSYDMAF